MQFFFYIILKLRSDYKSKRIDNKCRLIEILWRTKVREYCSHLHIGGAFQVIFQEHCMQADIIYVPAVVVYTRGRVTQMGPSAVDERKTTKPGKKDDKSKPPGDDKPGNDEHTLRAVSRIQVN